MTTNRTNNEIKKEQIEIGDLVFLYNEGKHIVDSFTKTAIRFKCIKNNKIQTVNKNTFLKKHFYTKSNYWMLEQKNNSGYNADYA